MYIEEVILEGFKSYAARTVISGWDPEFNAITGLNGTGKSNILDAICFVLGIDNLRQVRATSLQDLVYKRGQAGITKASVTVVFNNSNAGQSPIGYVDCPQVTVTRQIVLNGKNKYLINGHNAQQKAVENLFQSVQLNVNNPHFLIMQGQITRVLNMKPEEILAMIEESAGTRMFEDRKIKAISTMEKKEKKVDEIAALINDTIAPKLNTLRMERADFLEYKRTEADLEKLQRLLTAFDYQKASTLLESRVEEAAELHQQLSSHTNTWKQLTLELENVSDEALNVAKRRQKEANASHRIRELEDACRESAATMAKLQAEIDFKKEALQGEEREKAAKLSDLANEEKKRTRLTDKMEKIEKTYRELEEAHGKLQAELQRDEDLLRSLETGLSGSDESAETGFAKLLKLARDRSSKATVAIKKGEMRAKTLKSEISSMDQQVKRASKDSESSLQAIADLKSQISSLEMELSTLSPGSVSEELQRQRSDLQSRLAILQEELHSLESAVASVDFRYSMADPSFDHGKVRGMVASLVRLEGKNLEGAAALEVAAGGRLFNVVVEDEKTATDLLDKGRLARRVTIIPLNKIKGKTIPAEKVKMAEQMTRGEAKIGLSLVGYDLSVAAAMEYVFGSTFICNSKEAAALVAFDRRLGCRAVTLQGDVYEPSGTLSGGSAPSGGNVLERLTRYRELSQAMSGVQSELAAVEAKIRAGETSRRQHAAKEREIRALQAQLASLTRQFELHAAGQLMERHAQACAELSQVEKDLEAARASLAEAQLEIETNEREARELSVNREGKLADLAARIASTKARIAKEEAAYTKSRDEYQRLKNELAACGSLLSALEGNISTIQGNIDALSEALHRLNSDLLECMTVHNGVRIKLEGELHHLQRFDRELKALESRKRELGEALETCDLEKKKLEDQIAHLDKDIKANQERLEQWRVTDPWILDAMEEGPFDFDKVNMSEVRSRVKSLLAQKETLRKTINFDVMEMIDRVEAKDSSLKQMLNTVKKDRSKIEGTITKLNEHMLETLHRTWTKVNGDFGQIFGELLPGSTAKLDPLEGQAITDGLEIKVCLGGVWKKSLAELSGGQRSLVALSLILALLQYKPAPMYILDEVDAALDLSHTENIGRLLRSRFKGSQFIVVSLKEGMFANANVLFRTRFRDGVSGVDRTDNVGQPKPILPNHATKKTAGKLQSKPAAVEASS